VSFFFRFVFPESQASPARTQRKNPKSFVRKKLGRKTPTFWTKKKGEITGWYFLIPPHVRKRITHKAQQQQQQRQQQRHSSTQKKQQASMFFFVFVLFNSSAFL
jgi:hypothetical protein